MKRQTTSSTSQKEVNKVMGGASSTSTHSRKAASASTQKRPSTATKKSQPAKPQSKPQASPNLKISFTDLRKKNSAKIIQRAWKRYKAAIIARRAEAKALREYTNEDGDLLVRASNQFNIYSSGLTQGALDAINGQTGSKNLGAYIPDDLESRATEKRKEKELMQNMIKQKGETLKAEKNKLAALNQLLQQNLSGAQEVSGFDLSVSQDGLDAFLRVKAKAEEESQKLQASDRKSTHSERPPLSEIGEIDYRLGTSYADGINDDLKSTISKADECMNVERPIDMVPKPSTPMEAPQVNQSIQSLKQEKVKETTPSKKDDSSRFNEILSFLEQQSEASPQKSLRGGKASAIPQTFEVLESSSATQPPQQAYAKAKAKMVTMKIELEQQNHTIAALTKALEHQKQQNQMTQQKLTQEKQHELEKQNLEFESQFEKKLEYIEQLIQQKATVVEEKEKLEIKLEGIEKRHEKNITEMQKKFEIEMERNKQAWRASEEVRLKKALEKEKEKVKIDTVKALEPEVQNLMMQKKEALRKGQEAMKDALRKQREELEEIHEQAMSDLKDKMQREFDKKLLGQHDQREELLNKQRQALEKQFDQDRQRFRSQMDSEIEQMEDKRRKERRAYEEDIQELKNKIDRMQCSSDTHLQDKLEELQRKKTNEIRDLESKFKYEKEEWQSMILAQQRKELQEEKDRIRKEQIELRDKEISMVVDKLAQEKLNIEKKTVEEKDSHLKDIEKHYRIEVMTLKKEISELQQQLESEKASKGDIDESVSVLTRRINQMQSDLDQKDREIGELKDDNVKLAKRLATIQGYEEQERDQLIQQHQRELTHLKNEIASLKQSLSDSLSSKDQAVFELESKHQQEMEILKMKAKEVLQKKDDVIGNLQDEVEERLIQCKKYKELLEEERKKQYMLN